MKISNSKKQLAKIINDSCGWRESALWAVQHWNGNVVFTECNKPKWSTFGAGWEVDGNFLVGCHHEKLKHCNQTILSRDEYFHMYSEPCTNHFEESLDMVETNQEHGPTIEQLTSDYKSKMEIANQAQEVADFRRSEADGALYRLHLAGLDIGLDIAIASDDDDGYSWCVSASGWSFIRRP